MPNPQNHIINQELLATGCTNLVTSVVPEDHNKLKNPQLLTDGNVGLSGAFDEATYKNKGAGMVKSHKRVDAVNYYLDDYGLHINVAVPDGLFCENVVEITVDSRGFVDTKERGVNWLGRKKLKEEQSFDANKPHDQVAMVKFLRDSARLSPERLNGMADNAKSMGLTALQEQLAVLSNFCQPTKNTVA